LNRLLSHPRTLLVALFGLLAFFAYHARGFQLDASADSLLLEDDPDLQLSRQVDARYQSRDLLIVTFTPDGPLFDDASLDRLRALRNELRELDGVESVTSILDVPLVKSSDVPLLEMIGNLQTLESPTVDRRRAIEELTGSPVFESLIVSADELTTAILVYLKPDDGFETLLRARNELLVRRRAEGLSAAERDRLAAVTTEYERTGERVVEHNHRTIGSIRTILERHRPYASLHLGGVPMIADDMVEFIGNDLAVFGASVLAFLIFVLALIFRQLRWVVLPLLCCFFAVVIMVGMLGLFGWKVTVISSNFLALMLIITISMNLHLAVRYNQLFRELAGETQLELVAATVRSMVWPCLYTALTTIIGFGSLVFSNIKPVQDLGWMMSMGLAVSFATTFTLFPAVLVLLSPRAERVERREVGLTAALANLTDRHGGAILGVSTLLACVSAVGLSRLTVENSFIDYFRQNTEIYQGMKLIDDKLGGTTPLEVLIHFGLAKPEAEVAAAASAAADAEFDDEFLEEWELDEDEDPDAYWFTASKIETIKRVHDYLDGFPEVGKVLSLASVIRVAEELNDGEAFDGLELSVLYKKLPAEVREPLVDPYLSVENDEARILLRIIDSQPGLRRKELLQRIEAGFGDQLMLSDGEVQITGTLLLYNNMLQSLFRSQIMSIGAVMVGIGAMFLILFRSVSLAVIGIVPNLLAAAMVLGLMGLVGIPLDIMTITVAAITVGIAVDDGIHYIYRFREEFAKNGDYRKTLHICHGTIGHAVLYTSVTVTFGFSILVLSNFLPTIYFGLLTGLAMGIAFLGALTLLPKLILMIKPFGVDGARADREPAR